MFHAEEEATAAYVQDRNFAAAKAGTHYAAAAEVVMEQRNSVKEAHNSEEEDMTIEFSEAELAEFIMDDPTAQKKRKQVESKTVTSNPPKSSLMAAVAKEKKKKNSSAKIATSDHTTLSATGDNEEKQESSRILMQGQQDVWKAV